MKNINWKKLLPHIIAVISFLVISALFCKPALEGKVLYQHDIIQYEGSSKDIADYSQKHGEAPLWTNGMFSGMPTYQIWMPSNNLLPHYVNKALTLGLPQPMQFFFLACILFYFLSQVARVNPYIGIFGSLAFGFSTFNSVMIAAGHVTQMWCVAYMPAMLGSLMLIYRKKYLLGAGLLALFTATQIGLNHLQVSYYLFFILAFYTVACVIRWIRNKEYAHMIKALAFTAIAALMGIMVNSVNLLTTYEYSKETIRGGSLSLKDSTAKAGTGLSKEYAFQYSYKPMEAFTVMFPHMFGGSNGTREIGDDSKVQDALRQVTQQDVQQLKPEQRQTISNDIGSLQGAYWGALPYTAGPPYFGALIWFLVIVFLVLIKDERRWWIAGISLFAFLLSWGRLFPGFNYFMFDHLPLYNKFRAPSMSLIIPQLLWPFAAIIGLQALLNLKNDSTLNKKVKTIAITTGVVFVVMFMAYLSLPYLTDGGKVARTAYSTIPSLTEVFKAAVEVRKGIFLQDIFKALLIIGAFFGLTVLYLRNKIKGLAWIYVPASILILIDLLPVGSMYLNKTAGNEDAWSDEQTKAEQIASPMDRQVMNDTGYYRVVNLSTGDPSAPFADATTSYFHRSIGGYHAAKIGRYQDLIENKLVLELNLFLYSMSYDSTLANGLDKRMYTALNMLNTKYIIKPPRTQNEQPSVMINPNALGAAWFVREIKFANDQRGEMKDLDSLDASQTAIVSASDKSKITQPAQDSAATITKVPNGDDHDILTYKSSASSNQFAVFSEVYYSEGWNTYIDGKKSDYVKTNYALRGMNVPAGNHTIEFKFEPPSYKQGRTFTSIGQVIVLMLLLTGIFVEIRNRRKSATRGNQ